jgi:hypothetical protein
VVESVKLGGAEEATIDAVVRAHHVPGRRFGWRIPVWPAPYPSPTPEVYAGLFPVYLMEFINTLPHAAAGTRCCFQGRC